MSEKSKIEQLQLGLSEKYDAPYRPLKMDEAIGVSAGVISGEQPFNGLRHPSTETTSGWYIWSGDYSEEEGFFTTIHASHLIELQPDLIPYLGLPPGWRFLVDSKHNYEDVWRDASLLSVED